MCIAILNTKKAGRLPKTQIKNSWDNNDMGSGLLWNKDGKLNVFKTYEYDEYIEMYNKLRDDSTIGNIVLHFRIATSGYNGEHNLHPFLVNDDLGFVHNGVIRGLGNKKFSDTYEFNDMLKKYKHNFLTCEMSKFFISEYIGYSKLIFLDSKDKYTIINEDMGKWADGNWYSNDSYKEYSNYVYYGNTKVSKTATNTTAIADDFDEDGWLDYNHNEWDMYEYICDIYGLDPDEEQSFKDIEYYMAMNDAKDITEFYKTLTQDFNF
jgi:predicted glutamine amidotransferase